MLATQTNLDTTPTATAAAATATTTDEDRTNDRLWDAGIESSIALRVNDLIGRYGFRRQDREDLLQEARLAVWERLQDFVPGKVKRSTYIVRTIEQCLGMLIRRRYAQCRSPERLQDLQDTDGNSHSDFDTVAQDQCASFDPVDFHIDLRPVLDRLTPQQLSICQLLGHRSYAAIQRMLGLSRHSFDRDLATIRDLFRQHELSGYLTSLDTSPEQHV